MECVIKSREVDAFSWKHQESSVMTTSHFITLPFETKTENIILGFDMFHFEYPDKDHHVKDMGLNIRYNVLKERADTIIFHADRSFYEVSKGRSENKVQRACISTYNRTSKRWSEDWCDRYI